MAPNPLKQSIREAVRYNKELLTIFRFLGDKQHSRGKLISLYRDISRDLKSAIKKSGENNINEVRNIMGRFRVLAEDIVREAVRMGTDLGQLSAGNQLGFNEIVIPSFDQAASNRITEDEFNQAMIAILASIDSQAVIVESMALVETERDLILGDGSRAGVFRLGRVKNDANFWTTQMAGKAFALLVGASQLITKKQAIALLDGRTTECCLLVHGQVRNFAGQFETVGSPAWSQFQSSPPFHWNCRTAEIIYEEKFDDGFTEEMRAGADSLLVDKRLGITRVIKNPGAFL